MQRKFTFLKIENRSTEENDINALLTEYNAIKAEETACETAQTTIITTLFSFIAAILGLNFLFGFEKNIPEERIQFMVLGFCMLLVMFFGCMWMYQLYCHMRFGAYLYHLEEDINECYKESKRKIYFEHWIINQESGRPFILKTSWLYGCVTFGTWIIAPVLLLFLSTEIFPTWDVRAFYFQHGCVRKCFFIIIAITYYFIQASYLIAILNIKNKKHLSESRIRP